jgi:hypothetical protein
MDNQIVRLANSAKRMLDFAIKAACTGAASASVSLDVEWARNWSVMMAYVLDLFLHDPRLTDTLRDRLRSHLHAWQQFAETASKEKCTEWAASVECLVANKTDLKNVLEDISRG